MKNCIIIQNYSFFYNKETNYLYLKNEGIKPNCWEH